MSNAKQCDRCHEFFTDEDFSGMPYEVKGADQKEKDLCKTCRYDLEDFMDNFKGRKGKKTRKTSVWSEENLKAAGERQALRVEIAKLVQAGSPDTEWHDAVAKAAMRIRNAKDQGVSMEDLKKTMQRTTNYNEERGAKKPMCSSCGKNKVDNNGDMCKACEEEWNDYLKHKEDK